jgi:hypothetical protein
MSDANELTRRTRVTSNCAALQCMRVLRPRSRVCGAVLTPALKASRQTRPGAVRGHLILHECSIHLLNNDRGYLYLLIEYIQLLITSSTIHVEDQALPCMNSSSSAFCS